MFRDDAVALAEQNEQLRREAERLAAENAAMRAALQHHRVNLTTAYTMTSVYERPTLTLTDGERVAYGQHTLTKFPAWAAVLLHLFTFGLSSAVLFARAQGRLPRLRDDDPTAARAFGFFLIPYVNFWWMFFAPLRLIDRINLQYVVRGREAPLTKGLAVFGAVSMFFMYFLPIAWLPAVWKTQRAINDLVDLGPVTLTPESAAQQLTGVRIDPAAQWAALIAEGQEHAAPSVHAQASTSTR